MISASEREFVLGGFRQGVRADGRANGDSRFSKVQVGNIQESFGSSRVTFGEHDTQIICAIKADVRRPLQIEPTKGQIVFHLESSQTGSSLFTREEQADATRTRLL